MVQGMAISRDCGIDIAVIFYPALYLESISPDLLDPLQIGQCVVVLEAEEIAFLSVWCQAVPPPAGLEALAPVSRLG